MIISVNTIPEDGESLREEVPSEELQLDTGDLHPEGPLVCDVFVQRLGDTVIVRGRLELPVRVECARCTEIFSTTVRDSAFLRDYLLQDGQFEIDVTPDLREAVLLEFPGHPVCRPDCKGLCPQCGKNRNRGRCRCRLRRRQARGKRWNA